MLQEDIAQRLLTAFAAQQWRLQIIDRTQKERVELLLDQPMDPSNPMGVLEYIGQGMDYVKQKIDLNNLFYIRQIIDMKKAETGILQEYANFLNSAEFIEPMKEITGKTNATYVAAEATCYSKGCFLGEHDDAFDPDNLVAFVFYLTPEWRADWGGILMFENGIIPPMWNTLGLFTVPVKHFVSSVSPAATKNRYSVTGWLKGDANNSQ